MTEIDAAKPGSAVADETNRPACPFSIVMNVYNGERYVAEAIDSVLAQTFADWELIIWDDCSTDDSYAVCARYTDPRIRRFRSPTNTGLGMARNLAIREARGEWVAFLDQDDIWLPHKLAEQHALIAEDQTGELALVYGRTVRFDARGRTSNFDPWFADRPLPEGHIFAELLRKPCFVALCSLVFRRSALQASGEVPSTIVYIPDYYLIVMIARDYRAACVQQVCCRYRIHPKMMTRVSAKQIHEEALRIIEGVAGNEHRRILRTRRRVYESLIAVEEIRSGHYGRAAWRILRKGSIPYLALRPLVMFFRRIRDQLRPPPEASAPRHHARFRSAQA